MNTAVIDRVAKALLYEGYLLYPYRPSAVKNQHRFNFGVLYPRAYSEAQQGADSWFSQTEVVVLSTPSTAIEVKVRFLHLMSRSIEQLTVGSSRQAEWRAVERLEVDGNVFQPWQEAVEREISLPPLALLGLTNCPFEWPTEVGGDQCTEDIYDTAGTLRGAIKRTQQPIEIAVEVSANRVNQDLTRVMVRVKNQTLFAGPPAAREQVLLRAPVSTHVLLGAQNGAFVSLLEPPDELRPYVAACENIGIFPVLIGPAETTDTMFAAPIILYDYPQVAAESAGDLFDSTEIDEILSLRIMTLTDEEKREARSSDELARRILERTDNLREEQWTKLHGAARGLRPIRHEELQ